jgi:hypothetical protein
MREYEIYLPGKRNDGSRVPSSEFEEIEGRLFQAFGGFTHLKSRIDGAWRMGGVTLLDEVTIIRVLDDGSARFDMAAFKRELEERLKQESVLIVAREVQVV